MSDYREMVEKLEKFGIKQKYSLKLELPGVPPSLNVMLRKHYHERKKINDYWYSLVLEKSFVHVPVCTLKRAKLCFIRHSPRTLDYDGVVGSLKPICDGLKRAGIIHDDSWNCVGAWEVDQVKQKEQKITVEVREI